MAEDIDLGGRDEPLRSSDDHAELLSELDSHDLAVAADPESDSNGFEYDPDADPDTVFPQSVASGGPIPPQWVGSSNMELSGTPNRWI